MPHIYVTTNGSLVGLNGGRITVSQKGEVISSIPKETVDSVFIFGNSAITTPCMQYLLRAGIPTCFFSGKGKYYGRLEALTNNKTETIKAQFAAFDNEDFAMPFGRRILSAKIKNQEIILKRYIKEMTPALRRNIALLKVFRKKCLQAKDVTQLMGYEGIAARTYFKSISMIIDPEFAFQGRTKHPPKDRFNAMLSFGYMLLMSEIHAVIETKGMTAYYSVLHKSTPKYPALASDLMEEWRSVVVDSAVLSLIQGHEIHTADFAPEEEDGGIYLSRAGLTKYLHKFEKKIETTIKYLQYDNNSSTIRDALQIQCDKLRESVEKQDPDIYIPILLK